jgi:hypothetical protein
MVAEYLIIGGVALGFDIDPMLLVIGVGHANAPATSFGQSLGSICAKIRPEGMVRAPSALPQSPQNFWSVGFSDPQLAQSMA